MKNALKFVKVCAKQYSAEVDGKNVFCIFFDKMADCYIVSGNDGKREQCADLNTAKAAARARYEAMQTAAEPALAAAQPEIAAELAPVAQPAAKPTPAAEQPAVEPAPVAQPAAEREAAELAAELENQQDEAACELYSEAWAQIELEDAAAELFVFETHANPRFVDVLLGNYIAATIQQRGHADSPACLCSAYIAQAMYFSSIAEAVQYIKNNAAEFAAVIRKQRAEPLRVPKAAQDVEWRTLDSFEYEGWFDNTSKGGICCFVPRWCLCIDEQGNRTIKVVRLKKDAHTGNWAAYDERTQVYSPDATGRALLERIQVIAYLHNPNDVPIERALYEARESAQRYGAPQQLVGA
jgi:hypothetical protein